MKQKLTAFLLCFVMVLSLCAVLPFGSLAAEEVWLGSAANAYAGGSGTPEDPYQIANGEQLALMAQQINAGENASASFILVENIVLNDVENYENFATAAPANVWAPIGAEATPFSGNFDGNGKTISGLYLTSGSYSGLFGVTDGATIKNVTLAKGYVKNNNYIGALVGWAQNSTISAVTNESVYVRCEKSGTSAAGGIVGKATVTDVIDCHNTAQVYYKEGTNRAGYVGGVVGECTGASYADRSQILNCTSDAIISGAGKNNPYNNTSAGGIVGIATYYNIVGCVSKGIVRVQTTGQKNAGGIAASVVSCYVISCVSYAHVDTGTYFDSSIGNSGNDCSATNGGIVGNASYTGHNDNHVYVENCVFLGTQNTFFDQAGPAKSIGMIYAGTGGGARIKFRYSYGLYTPYQDNTNEIGIYPVAQDTNVQKQYAGNYALSAENVNGTATDPIDASATYANVPSIVEAMNNYAKAQGYGSVTFSQGENGPEVYGVYEESYLVNVDPTENGTVVLEGKPAIFPDGYEGLVSGYKEGQTAVVSLVPAEGYVPYKLEYTFNGETVELQKDELGKYSFVMPAGEVTLSAIFVEAGASTELKVVFLGKDGSIIDEQIVSYKGAAVAPEAPVVEGYDFIDWDIAFDEVKTDLIVNAVYQIQTYTVIFYDSLGNVLSEQAVDYGFAAVAPEAPAVEGHVFGGWDYAFDFVKGDMTITATYKKIYTVTFLGFGGVMLGEPQPVVVGESAVAPEAPEVGGYKFEGWDVDFSCIEGDLTVNAVYAFDGNFFSGGKGTANAPWQLGSIKDFADLREMIENPATSDIFVSAYYELVGDIDFADETLNPYIEKNNKGVVTNNWLPVSNFSGSINGNGYALRNLKISRSGSVQAIFLNISGVLENLKLVDCTCSTSANENRAILALNTQGELLVKNCHIINGQIGTGSIAGLMFCSTQGTKVTIENCSVSGEVIQSNLNCSVGGYFNGCSNVSFVNCTAALTVNERNISNAGGFVSNVYANTSFSQCVSYSNISIASNRDRSCNIAGFVANINNNSGSITFRECTFSGSLINNGLNTNSQAGGFVATTPANATIYIYDCAVYGTIHSENSNAGGLFASFTNQDKQGLVIENAVVLADVTCGANGSKGAITSQLKVTAGSKIQNVYVLSEDLITEPSQTIKAYEVFVLDSLTTLPEGLQDNPAWTIGATLDIAGVSVSLGNNMSINVFAKTGIVVKVNAGKLYVDGQFITAGDKVTIGGVDYVKFIYDGFKVADMDKTLELSLVGFNPVQKKYAITTYITNIYGAEDGKYQPLLDAMLYYGDAAQKAKYGTSTVLATAALKLEKEFSADYVATNFATANLKTHAGLSAAGIALNLYGNITPILKVDASVSEVTVSYNGKTATMATQLAVDEDGNEYAYVIYTELLATSLNNLMTVSYVLDGEEVTFDTNVAMYIETALNTQDLLTEDEATLAKALAVYMRAARTFVGLD